MALTDIVKTIGKGSVKAVATVAKGSWWLVKNVGNEAIKTGTGIDLIEENEKAKMRAQRQLARELEKNSDMDKKEISDRQKALYIKEMYGNSNSFEKIAKEHNEDKLRTFASTMTDNQLLQCLDNNKMNDVAKKVVKEEIKKRNL